MEELNFNDGVETKPTEQGWYHHTNGRGVEEIVYVYINTMMLWMRKVNGEEYPLYEDKGVFGERIPLPSED